MQTTPDVAVIDLEDSVPRPPSLGVGADRDPRHGHDRLDVGLVHTVDNHGHVELVVDQRVHREVGRVHTLFINAETGFAYANGSDRCDGGLHMVDVRNPLQPRFAGCFFESRSSATTPSARMFRDCGIAVPTVAEHTCYEEPHLNTILKKGGMRGVAATADVSSSMDHLRGQR